MRLLIVLIVLGAVAAVPYYIGRLRAEKQPDDNHRALARWAEAVLRDDADVPIMKPYRRDLGERLVAEYYDQTTDRRTP